MAYRVGTETVGERTVYHLRDDATGASASVLPSVGFNLFDLRLPVAGEVRPIVASADDWPAAPELPSRNGIPVLFPFPNRIRDARYTFEGRDYELAANKGPNAIHGFALESPWEVVALDATAAGARIIGRFRLSEQAPEDLPRWPSDAAIELSYTLAGRRLTLEATVRNPGPTDLPWGFGIHPYFRLPFDPSADPARTRVVLPASKFWVLDDALPTGEVRPVDPPRDFRLGKPMAGLQADDVLTGLDFEGGRCTCRLIDENLGAEFRMSFGRTFRELVVFTPPFHPGNVVAVEPYTQTTDAIHLQPRGIDAGLRVLAPGQSERLAIAMETADLG
jgi:aldose 1-epimerase